MTHRPSRPSASSPLVMALEPRIMFDAAAVATAADTAAATAAQDAPSPDAPTVEAEPVENQTYSIDGEETSGDVPVFGNADVALDGNAEDLETLTITVDRAGDNQALVIDGTEVRLVVGNGTTAGHNYVYSVSGNGDGGVTISISIASSSDAYGPDGAETLINGIRYRTLDHAVENGDVTVSIDSLSDYGGQVFDADIATTIHIENSTNVAPELTPDIPLAERQTLSPDDLTGTADWSADGDFVYVGTNTGGLAVYRLGDDGSLTRMQTIEGIDGVSSFSHLSATADGTALYALSDGSLHTFSLADDGTATYDGTISVGAGAMTLALSDDGKQVYVGTQWNGLYAYTRDAETGALTQSSLQTTNVSRSPGLTSSGDYVFATSDTGFSSSTLTVYRRNGDGSLESITDTLVPGAQYFGSDWVLASSDDGSTLYVGDRSSGQITVLSFDGSSFTEIMTVQHPGMVDMTPSDTGDALYVVTGDGSLTTFAVTKTGALSRSGTLSGSGGGGVLSAGQAVVTVGSDGGTVYDDMLSYSRGGDPVRIADGMTLSDRNLDVDDNYGGASVTVTTSVPGGTFGIAGEDGLILSDGTLSRDGTAIGTMTTDGDHLTITFADGVTGETANMVLRQITYANESADSGTRVELSLRASDGALESASWPITVRLNTSPAVTEPDTAIAPATTETPYSVTLDEALFTDPDGDPLTWTVDGLPDGLTFDPLTRVISGTTEAAGSYALTVTVRDSSGGTAETTVTLEVEQIANRDPVVSADAPDALDPATADESYSLTLPADLFTDPDSQYGDTLTWTVEGLPDGLTFDPDSRTISGTASAVDDYTLTITATDAAGRTTSVTVALRVITPDEAANRPPELTVGSEGTIYDANGTLDGVEGYVSDMTLSDDGTLLFIVTTSEVEGAGATTLHVFQRDPATGALTAHQVFVDGATDDGNAANGIEVPGLTGPATLALSADGTTLYVAAESEEGGAVESTILLFDIADGTLTRAGDSVTVEGTVLDLQTSADGAHLYALTAGSLHAFPLSDGTPAEGTALSLEGQANRMTIAEDGTVYVLSGSRLTIAGHDGDGDLLRTGLVRWSGSSLFFTDSEGQETQIAPLDNSNAFNGPVSMVTSPGGFIHIATQNGFVSTLQYTTGPQAMSLVEAHSAWDDVTDYPASVALSGDGKSLIMGTRGGKLGFYSIEADGTLTFRDWMATDGANDTLLVSGNDGDIYTGTARRFTDGGISWMTARAGATTGDYAEQETIPIADHLTWSDPDYDALNGGNGDYTGATLTLERATGAIADDLFGFEDGDGLVMTVDPDTGAGTLSLDGTTIAEVSRQDGTLTITFTGTTETATVNAILHRLTYTNRSDDPAGEIPIALRAGDAYTQTTMTRILTVTTENDAPTFDTTPSSPTHTDSGGSVPLFEDTTIDTVEDDQSVLSMTLTVSGLTSDSTDSLIIDGRAISLVDGAFMRTDSGYEVRVAVDGDTGTATLSIGFGTGAAAGDVATLLDGMTYANAEATDGTRVVTVTALTDSGGGTDTVTPDLSSTVTIEVDNTAPVIEDGSDPLTPADSLDSVPGLGDISATVISADGRTVYVADTSGAVAVLSRNPATGALTHVETVESGLEGVAKLTLSADGASLYALRQASGGTVLSGFQVDTDTGALGAAQVVPNDGDFGSPVDFAVSTDGTHVWMTTNWNSMVHYERDTETGALTQTKVSWAYNTELDGMAGLDTAAGYTFVAADGYNQDDIAVITASGDGTPSIVASLPINDISAVSVSEDGRTIFALGSDGITILSFDPDTQTLTKGGVIPDTAAATGLSAAADGLGLTVTHGDGRITVYAMDSGAATLVQTLNGDDVPGLMAPTSISIANDGAVVVVSDGSVLTFLGHQAPTPHVIGLDPAPFAEDLSLSDMQFDALPDGGDYAGAVLTVSASSGAGTFGFTDPAGEITLEDGALFLDGTQIATLSQSGGDLTVTITGTVTTETATQILRGLTYAPTDTPAGETVTLSIALDDGALSSRTVTVDVLSQPNTPPEATDETVTLDDVVVDTEDVSITLPETLFSDAEGETLTWSVDGLPDGLSFDPATRTISGTPTTVQSATITITVTDGAGGTATRTVPLEIVPPNQPPEAGTDPYAPPTATAGVDYETTLPADLFSDPEGDPLTWAVTDLPDGLSFDPETRTISGTPPTDGTFDITVTVTDAVSGGETARTISLTVDPNAPPEAGPSAYTPPPATVGEAYRSTLPADLFVDPDDAVLSWQVDGLPEGLSFDPQTRTLSGTPTGEGTVEITVTATSPNGASVSRTFTLVAEPAVTVNPLPLPEPPPAPSAAPSPAPLPGEAPLSDTASPAPGPQTPPPRDTGMPAGLADPLAFLRPVGEQLSMTAAPDFTPEGLDTGFVRQGDTWISTLPPATDGAPTATLRLPAGLTEGTGSLRLRLSNGLPLPTWLHYDAATQTLSVDRAALDRAGDIRLRAVVQDADGSTRTTILEIRGSSETSALPAETDAPPAQGPRDTARLQPPTDPAAPGPDGARLEDALQATGPRSLLEDARALLASLAGLPDVGSSTPSSPPTDPSRPSA